MLGTTYYCYTQNIKALDLMVSDEKIFLRFPVVSLRKMMTPWAVANLDSRSVIGRIYVGYHYLLLHTKYKSSGPHGLREEDVFIHFPIV